MIIDYASRPPVPEFSQIQAVHLTNYRRVYAAGEKQTAADGGAGDSLPRYFDMYDQIDTQHVITKARDLDTSFEWRIRNEDVAAFCRTHGERFIGFAEVDPNKGIIAVRELDVAVRELGLKGLNLQCFEPKPAINDKRMSGLKVAHSGYEPLLPNAAAD